MDDKSAAETVTNPSETPPPKPPAPAPAVPAPAPSKTVVKDEKWLESEIARKEDELHQLRELKKTTSPRPANKPSKTNWGTLLNDNE